MATAKTDRSVDFSLDTLRGGTSGFVTPPRSPSLNKNNSARDTPPPRHHNFNRSSEYMRSARKSPSRNSSRNNSPAPARSGRATTLNESLPTSDRWSDSENEKEEALPSINERLAYLRPSRELLEYYRKKIGEFDKEHDEMMQKLEQYRMTYEEQHKIHWEMKQREEEIAELQKALSDMQVYLFEEREHVLRLYAENDRLKLRELEDRKKIHTLLQLSGVTESEISYFLKEPPAKAVVEQKLPQKLQNNMANRNNTGPASTVTGPTGPLGRVNKGKKIKEMEVAAVEEKYRGEKEVLMLQVEALQAQLQEQSKLAKEQMEAMLEDRRVRMEEAETNKQRDVDKVQLLTEKLRKTQDLLYTSTKDFLSLRYDHRRIEKEMMSDRDKILRELDQARLQLDTALPHRPRKRGPTVLNVQDDMMEEQARREEEIRTLQDQLAKANKMQEMYREQVIHLEDDLSRTREEGDIGKDIFKDRSEKMAKRLGLMNARYADLERRRNLENEGFQTDIKNLRKRLKELEKQLYKLTIGMQEELNEKRPDDIDMRILKSVHKTAGRSKEISDELKTLKAKVYGMENDLRHL